MSRLTAEQAARVEAVAPRVDKIAAQIQRMWPSLAFDDLRSAGYEGLVQSALRYDPNSGVPFEVFSYYRIRGAMIDHGRRLTPGSRRLSRAQRALAAQQALFEEASRRGAPERDRVADKVARARDLVAQATVATALTRALDDEPETVAAQDSDPESRLIRHELKTRLQRTLGSLEPDDRALVDAIYLRGESMNAYAERIGVNTSTISRRHRRVVQWLAAELTKR